MHSVILKNESFLNRDAKIFKLRKRFDFMTC